MSLYFSFMSKTSSIVSFRKYFLVTLFLILVSPAFAIDESEFEKKVFALDWKTEPGAYEIIGTNAFLKITSEEYLVLGEDANDGRWRNWPTKNRAPVC